MTSNITTILLFSRMYGTDGFLWSCSVCWENWLLSVEIVNTGLYDVILMGVTTSKNL